MDKKQFIQFKKDLKNDIEITRIYNSDSKQWWNQGFKTKEDYDKSWELKKETIRTLESEMSKKENGWLIISYPGFSENLAYYSAKHQLTQPEREEYVKNMFEKMRENKRNEYSVNHYFKQVEKIISEYEKIVCSD